MLESRVEELEGNVEALLDINKKLLEAQVKNKDKIELLEFLFKKILEKAEKPPKYSPVMETK